jgi:Nuclease-related domain
VGAVALLLWLKRRRRAARNERPPQRGKLLRPPGHSLLKRLDELDTKFLSTVLVIMGAGAIFGIGIIGLYPILEGLASHRFTLTQLRAQPGFFLLLWGAVATLVSILCIVHGLARISKFLDDWRNCVLGRRGEQAVAEALAKGEVIKAGYVSFHDVPGDGPWNIDHAVVGPGGIFVLETKTRSRRRATRDQEEHKVFFDGRTLRFPWCDDHNAAKQAEWNASWVREFIEGFAPKDMIVQPIVVVPGWWVESQGNYPVKAMNAEYLVVFLTSCKTRFTPQQLQPVLRRFEERCRDVEF